MAELFGVPYGDLTFEVLERFLAEPEPEPLLWEAKGGEPNPNEIRKQCGGFANSHEGGYLILGAEEQGKPKRWVLSGMAFPDGEPHRYVTDSLQGGVRPVPTYDVIAFEVAPSRHVAVVRVEPLPAGPCIVRGTVYERVPGVTIAVKDPARLADLYARGDEAHRLACAHADNARADAFRGMPPELPRRHPEDPDELDKLVHVAVSVSSVGVPTDVGGRLFRSSTREQMQALTEGLANAQYPMAPETGSVVAQDRRVVWAQSYREWEGDWCMTAWWSGAVAVAHRARTDRHQPESLVSDLVLPAYDAALAIVRRFEGSAFGYLRVKVAHQDTRFWPASVTLGRGPLLLEAGDALDSASIVRELNRAVGNDTPEPEPEGL